MYRDGKPLWLAFWATATLLVCGACEEPREGPVLQLNTAHHNGDQFVVAGGVRDYEEGLYNPSFTQAAIATSADGETWEAHVPDADAEFTAVDSAEGRFLAVSDCVDGDGAVAVSEGGTTWTAYTGLPDACFGSAAVVDGTFWAAQISGGLFTSVDGVIWDEVERTLDAGEGPSSWTDDLEGIAHGNGVFVTWFGDELATSTNGADWIARDLVCAGESCDFVLRVVFLGDGFAAMAEIDHGEELAPGWYVALSGNGESWSAVEMAEEIVAVAHGDEVYVAASTDHLFSSPDGTDWDRGVKTVWDRQRTDLAYGDGLFVATGEATVMTSADGETWDELEFEGG